MSRRRGTDRCGLTLLELLIVVGLVGLLLALVMPAVQQSREAARRARCASNLRQIGLATQQYIASSGVFPANWGVPDFYDAGSGPIQGDMKAFSAFVLLLPHLDEVGLYHSVNFNVGIVDPHRPSGTFGRYGLEAHATAMRTVLGVLICTSDGVPALTRGTAGTNYRANNGTERWYISYDGPFMSRGGRQNSPADVLDGLSATALFSEKLRGRSGRLDPRRDMVIGGLGADHTVDESLAACESQGAAHGFYNCAGLAWFVSDLAQTNYNHVTEPNSHIPDCVLPGSASVSGLIGARSNHPGGVSLAMADGSVRFVSQSIARSVWRAIGSRAGGEVVDGL